MSKTKYIGIFSSILLVALLLTCFANSLNQNDSSQNNYDSSDVTLIKRIISAESK